MKTGRVFFLVAGIWEFIRFVAVFLSSAAAPAAISNSHLNLLWLAGPALILAALFLSSAYYPANIRAHIPILRIGAVIAVITDVAVVITGSYDWTLPGTGESATGGSRVLFVLAFGVLVVDLIVISLLLSKRLPEHDPADLDQT